MSLIIVTGMSGAGKSTAINALEDIGFFCVDNVPPQLLDRFAMLNLRPGGAESRMALVVDARAGEMFSEFEEALDRLDAMGCAYRLLFLDAADDVLLDRYKEGRRRHPLIGSAAGLTEAIAKERGLLASAKERADFVIDTSRTSLSVLKGRVTELFRDETGHTMTIECMSFGFKNGLPHEADLVFDVRCLPNPYYVPALKTKNGLDQEVRDFVMHAAASREMLSRITAFLDFSVPLYEKEGKSQLVVAFGCTGGHHRSVTFAQLVGDHLRVAFPGVTILHRDLEKK